MRCVKPSIATLSPSRMHSSTASARLRKRGIGCGPSDRGAYLRAVPGGVKPLHLTPQRHRATDESATCPGRGAARERCTADPGPRLFQIKPGSRVCSAPLRFAPCCTAPGTREMFTHSRTVRIEWGHCDPAGIVFYPNYFSMFRHSSVMLLEAALGMNKHALYETYDFHGYPMVETRARFFIPTRYCDDVVIETAIAEVRRSSFHLTHRLMKDGALGDGGFDH